MSERRLIVVKRVRDEAGGCNFCTRPHEVVYEVKGSGRQLTARFCNRCLHELERAKYL